MLGCVVEPVHDVLSRVVHFLGYSASGAQEGDQTTRFDARSTRKTFPRLRENEETILVLPTAPLIMATMLGSFAGSAVLLSAASFGSSLVSGGAGRVEGEHSFFKVRAHLIGEKGIRLFRISDYDVASAPSEAVCQILVEASAHGQDIDVPNGGEAGVGRAQEAEADTGQKEAAETHI